MRDVGTAYLLTALSVFGIAGLQRFYLGKPVTGILWMMTWGMLGFGTLYDLITMPAQVADFNRRALPPPPNPYPQFPPQALPAHGYGMLPGAPASYPGLTPPQANAPETVELRMLQLARTHGGRVTTIMAATELNMPIADAEKKLDELVAHGHAQMEVTDEGYVVYDFPAVRVS
ncbi:MAG: TM2 domain-containing protein [Myxococcales bacterium FL481]|nr:MAG: TM2 domain-containing protein [Myxococcales bacterium FL481]